jgi:hypothetical protein
MVALRGYGILFCKHSVSIFPRRTLAHFLEISAGSGKDKRKINDLAIFFVRNGVEIRHGIW